MIYLFPVILYYDENWRHRGNESWFFAKAITIVKCASIIQHFWTEVSRFLTQKLINVFLLFFFSSETKDKKDFVVVIVAALHLLSLPLLYCMIDGEKEDQIYPSWILSLGVVAYLSSYWFLSQSAIPGLEAWTSHLDLDHAVFHKPLTGGGKSAIVMEVIFLFGEKAVKVIAVQTLNQGSIYSVGKNCGEKKKVR